MSWLPETEKSNPSFLHRQSWLQIRLRQERGLIPRKFFVIFIATVWELGNWVRSNNSSMLQNYAKLCCGESTLVAEAKVNSTTVTFPHTSLAITYFHEIFVQKTYLQVWGGWSDVGSLPSNWSMWSICKSNNNKAQHHNILFWVILSPHFFLNPISFIKSSLHLSCLLS